jgi:lipoic acid synthetase
MGKECTRACGFCDIDFSKSPKQLDPDEPHNVLQSVQELGLKHVVITMVARDDLEDGGAAHLAAIVHKVRESDVTVELLTSDFQGKSASLDTIAAVSPDIFNHNIETVRRLTPRVRHTATYDRSLQVLSYMSKKDLLVKSGIMVGFGETEDEIKETLCDLKDAGCDVVTIGQYLKPSRKKITVDEYIHPDQFKRYEEYGHAIGIGYVYAGPFVRSSYNANLVIQRMNGQQRIIQSI